MNPNYENSTIALQILYLSVLIYPTWKINIAKNGTIGTVQCLRKTIMKM